MSGAILGTDSPREAADALAFGATTARSGSPQAAADRYRVCRFTGQTVSGARVSDLRPMSDAPCPSDEHSASVTKAKRHVSCRFERHLRQAVCLIAADRSSVLYLLKPS